MPIRVVLAEDQAMVLGALAALLEMEPDITVVARAANGREALDAVTRLTPDVLVTDIEMPLLTGLEVAATLKASHPAVHTIILTTFARPGYLRRAMDAGARGYLLKDRPAAELADAVRRVKRGLRVVDPALATEAWNADMDPLTERERQILKRAGDGRSSRDRHRTPPLRRHRTQLPLGSDRQTRRLQSHRRRPYRPRQGLALTTAPAITLFCIETM